MNGVKVWTNMHGMVIFRLHYSADPEKDAKWAEATRKRCTSEEYWQQEFEIGFHAMLGALLYNINEQATLYDSFAIPKEWTRIFALDPHPVKPHAAIWGALDPYGDLYIYREYWPSKVYNTSGGRVPEDDNQISIRNYLECVKYLESRDNPANYGHDEHIYNRVIDYAARAFGLGTSDDGSEQINFQQRFEQHMRDLDFKNCKFLDCKKDREVGIELVNDWLRPRDILNPQTDKFEQRSRLRISRDCPELIWQLRNNRRRPLTPTEAEMRDPILKRIEKRNDISDCLRYLCMSRPEFVDLSGNWNRSTYTPQYQGISY